MATPNYANSDMADLAHQLSIGPRHLRLGQFNGIDGLLELVDPEKSYPYDFVRFHITGLRPHKPNQRPSVGGEDLLTDLTTMAEHITRKAAIGIDDIDDTLTTQDDLASDLGVSKKTVRRWRSRGLLGLRVVCDDRVSRLMFTGKAVKRFKDRNKALVERGASFKLLTAAEKDGIADRAREILTEKRRKLHVVAQTIAAETGRAVETVRYTLRQYDSAHPDQAMFVDGGDPVVSGRARAIWNCHKRGDTPAQMAKAFGCSVSSIKSTILELKARQLKDVQIEYVDNELFAAPNADDLILKTPRPVNNEPAKKVRVPKGLSAYLRALYDVPLLTREQEADLFRRYNYLRFRAARSIESLDVFAATQRDLDDVQRLLDRAEAIKNELIKANLRLVVSIAKRHVGWADSIFEVVSDGNMSLMRAVEKFDFSLGNKFSTYASWAIMKNFARTVPENHYHMRRFVSGQDEMIDSMAGVAETAPAKSDVETVRAALTEGMKELTDRERTIVSSHFGLHVVDGSSITLEELGKRFGVTKERIRQIEKRAIGKLRDVLSPALLDAFSV
jgi:RNA polymerase primary sigma factor